MLCPRCSLKLTQDEIQLSYCFRCNKHLPSSPQKKPEGGFDVPAAAEGAAPAISAGAGEVPPGGRILQLFANVAEFQIAKRDLDFEKNVGELIFYPSPVMRLRQVLLHVLALVGAAMAGATVATVIVGPMFDERSAKIVGLAVGVLLFVLSIPVVVSLLTALRAMRGYRFNSSSGAVTLTLGWHRTEIPTRLVASVTVCPAMRMTIPQGGPFRDIEAFTFPLILTLEDGQIVTISNHDDLMWSCKAGQAIARFLKVPLIEEWKE
jgi:hypothetical protein